MRKVKEAFRPGKKEVLRHRERTDKAPLLVANLVIKISTIALRICCSSRELQILNRSRSKTIDT